jgi:hypothetical protein
MGVSPIAEDKRAIMREVALIYGRPRGRPRFWA